MRTIHNKKVVIYSYDQRDDKTQKWYRVVAIASEKQAKESRRKCEIGVDYKNYREKIR